MQIRDQLREALAGDDLTINAERVFMVAKAGKGHAQGNARDLGPVD